MYKQQLANTCDPVLQALQQFEEEKKLIWCDHLKNDLLRQFANKSDPLEQFAKKEKESSSAAKKCGRREFKKYKNTKIATQCKKMKIRMSGRN